MMTEDDRKEEIDQACRTNGCDEKAAKRHYQLFVFEKWDAHPPPGFIDWHKEHGQHTNPVTAWNSDLFRQDFYRQQAHPPKPITPQERAAAVKRFQQFGLTT